MAFWGDGKLLLLGLLVLSPLISAWAKAPEFPAPPPGFRIGMEMEMLPEVFSNISGYFDFDSLRAEKGAAIERNLPADFYDDYLRDYPQGLSELPEPVRKKLTEGLDLQKTVISQERSLLDRNGKSLDVRPQSTRIILPSQAQNTAPASRPQLILPDSMRAPSRPQPPQAVESVMQPKGELMVPKNTAWQTLYSRWKALDLETKRSLAHWENLSSQKKADLAFKYGGGGVKPKAHLPPEEKRLLEKLGWSFYSDAIEFRHREDLSVSDPNEFFDDVSLLAKRAGVERKILNPEDSRLKSAGLHFHVSVQDKDLTQLGKAFNRLALVRRISGGDLGDLTIDDRYNYDPSATSKGHVRIVTSNRLEFRNHSVPLQDELNLILKALSHLDQDPDQAVRTVDDETRAWMSDYVVDKLAEHRSEYLKDFAPYMTAEQRVRIQPAMELAESFADHPMRPPSPDLWEKALKIISGKDHRLKKRVLTYLQNEKSWPKALWAKIPDLMEELPLSTREYLAEALMGQREWPREVWERIPRWLTQEGLPDNSWLMTATSKQAEWPPEFVDRLGALLAGHDTSAQRRVLRILRDRAHWPEAIWDRYPPLLLSKAPEIQRAALGALLGQQSVPEKVKEILPTLLKSENDSVRKMAGTAAKNLSLSFPACPESFGRLRSH